MVIVPTGRRYYRYLHYYFFFWKGSGGHIYLPLASNMDDTTAAEVEDIVTKAINENEAGSDAAEQVHLFFYKKANPNKVMSKL